MMEEGGRKAESARARNTPSGQRIASGSGGIDDILFAGVGSFFVDIACFKIAKLLRRTTVSNLLFYLFFMEKS